jgi:hypothetical protein
MNESTPQWTEGALDPDAARATIEAAAGSWSDVDIDALIGQVYRAHEDGSRSASGPAGCR